jgi:pectinesterase
VQSQDYGLVFLQCALTREARIPINSVALGRAWRPTRPFADGRYGDPNAVGMAVYKSCWMDDHITVEGWDAMEYGARDGSRVLLRPEDARFFEFGNRGPGAVSSPKRRILSVESAKHYAAAKVLEGWSR